MSAAPVQAVRSAGHRRGDEARALRGRRWWFLPHAWASTAWSVRLLDDEGPCRPARRASRDGRRWHEPRARPALRMRRRVRCVGSDRSSKGGSVRNMATVSAAGSRLSGVSGRDVALILGAVGGTAGIGAAATTPVLSSRWYRRLNKPSWQPPGPVFGPVWSVIYTLIAASMLVARGRGGEQQRPLFVLFGTNLALNLAWTVIFFRGRSPLAAGVEIMALEGTTAALIVRAWPLSRLAALLLVPYALWIAFATALTWAIWARNR